MPGDSSEDQTTDGSAVHGQPARETSVPASQSAQDRAELLARARSFLTSPQVRLQHSDAKQAFLAEKGLTPSEINQLLLEVPPFVPPRTYPASPPSNLPNLLAGVARIFTWLTGTSSIVLFVYCRYLLPRLAQSYQSRLALRKHQSALVARMTEVASALKTSQAESYMNLPRIITVYEDSEYTRCHSIDDLLSHAGNGSSRPGADIPDTSILRCALEELGSSKPDGVPTEVLFGHLESKLRLLDGKEGAARQSSLWDQLNICPLFVSSVIETDATCCRPSRFLWRYTPPPLPRTPPLLASLENLHAAFRRSREFASALHGDAPPGNTARQRMHQALSDFTGFITTHTYSLGFPSVRGTNGVASGGDPVDEDIRREIRALKGLVLNRRSFLSGTA